MDNWISTLLEAVLSEAGVAVAISVFGWIVTLIFSIKIIRHLISERAKDSERMAAVIDRNTEEIRNWSVALALFGERIGRGG